MAGLVDYSKITNTPAAASWSGIKSSVPGTEAWPGVVDYSKITNMPVAASWTGIKASVPAMETWPGVMDYSKIANPPAILTQYTDAQAQTAVTWNTVAPSMPNGALANAKLATPNVTLTAQSPLTGGGTAALGGSVSIGLGTVPVANGGTGLNAFPPGSVAVMPNTGSAMAGLSAGIAGNLLASSGTGWSVQSAQGLGLARRSSTTITAYVRTDGSDTTCDGGADTPASSGKPCAFASPQVGLDAMPDVINGSATLQLGGGTYYAASGAVATLSVAKYGYGSLTISGAGTVTLSGALSSSPNVAAAPFGVLVVPGSVGTIVKNLVVTRVTNAGVSVTGAPLTIDGISVTSAALAGFACVGGAVCVMKNTNSVSGSGVGVFMRNGAILTQTETLNVFSNAGVGINPQGASQIFSYGSVSVTNNVGGGLNAYHGSNVAIYGTINLYNNGVAMSDSSSLYLPGSLTITGTGGDSLAVGFGATVSVPNPGALSITCGSKTGTDGVHLLEGGTLDLSSAASSSISGCNFGVLDELGGRFVDYNGPRTVSNCNSAVFVASASLYVHTNMPAATTCSSGATCL